MQQTLRNSLLALATSAGAFATCLADDNFIRQPNTAKMQTANQTSTAGRGANSTTRPNAIEQPARHFPSQAHSTAAQGRSISVLELVPPDLPSPAATGEQRSGLKWVAVSPNRHRTSVASHQNTNGLNSLQQDGRTPPLGTSGRFHQPSSVPSLDPQWKDSDWSSGQRSAQTRPDEQRRQIASLVSHSVASLDHQRKAEAAAATHSNLQRQQRMQMAAKVSLANMKYGQTGKANIGAPADAPEGWLRAEEMLSRHISKCEQLVKRRAYYSAREEALKASRYLVRLIDEWAGSYDCEPALDIALTALDEAEDFGRFERLATGSIRELIESHSSTALDGIDVANIAPLAAAKHYRVFATDALVYAAMEHPWMGEIFYTMGRVYQAEAQAIADESQSDLRWRAIAFYRAAAAVDPQNALALDQLGYVFLQLDNPTAAREALVASLRIDGTLSALQNLAEASRRLNDSKTRSWALKNHSQLAASQRAQSARPYVQVAPQAFVAMTPKVIRPSVAPNTLPPGPTYHSRQTTLPPTGQAAQGRVATIPGYPAR